MIIKNNYNFSMLKIFNYYILYANKVIIVIIDCNFCTTV